MKEDRADLDHQVDWRDVYGLLGYISVLNQIILEQSKIATHVSELLDYINALVQEMSAHRDGVVDMIMGVLGGEAAVSVNSDLLDAMADAAGISFSVRDKREIAREILLHNLHQRHGLKSHSKRGRPPCVNRHTLVRNLLQILVRAGGKVTATKARADQSRITGRAPDFLRAAYDALDDPGITRDGFARLVIPVWREPRSGRQRPDKKTLAIMGELNARKGVQRQSPQPIDERTRARLKQQCRWTLPKLASEQTGVYRIVLSEAAVRKLKGRRK